MKRKLLAGLVLGIMLLGVQLSFVVDSFPGFHSSADCGTCHAYNGANVYNETLLTADPTVDGLRDGDAMWDEDGHATYDRTMYIPVGTRFGGTHTFVKLTLGITATHFYMLASWEDFVINGTDEQQYEDSDGISIMFNIDNPNFDSGYGMDRAPGDTSVDMVVWKPAASADGTEESKNDYTPIAVAGNTYDQYITDDSRKDDTTQDWTVSAVHGNVSSHNENNYQVEFKRALNTGEASDVVFGQAKYYEFAVAVYDADAGSGHMSSPPYLFWGGPPAVPKTVTVTETEAPIASLFIFLGLFAVPVIARLRRR